MTYVSRFVSQRANRDPEPYRYAFGGGRLTADDNYWETRVTIFDPRPEYTQTRDPYPWLHDHDSENCHDNGDRMATNNGVSNIWAPRHDEFDPPVNPILAMLREEVAAGDNAPNAADGILVDDLDSWGNYWSDDEREHARRVLEKLVAVYS